MKNKEVSQYALSEAIRSSTQSESTKQILKRAKAFKKFLKGDK